MECMNCKRDVVPVKKFAWGWFLIWLIFGVGAIFYLIRFFSKPKDQCPACGKNVYVAPFSKSYLG